MASSAPSPSTGAPPGSASGNVTPITPATPPPPAVSVAPAATSGSPTATVLVPPERTIIFPLEKAKGFIQEVCFTAPPGITGYWSPEPKDLEGVETGLEKFLEEKGRPHRSNWVSYYRQVVGVLEDKKQFLLLSYFSQEYSPLEKAALDKDPTFEPERWKKEPYWANDGGDVYFRVLYDLEKKEFVWYERNGNA